MTYRNVGTGETIGNKSAFHLAKRLGTVEQKGENEVTRFVIDRDGTREEWVLLDGEESDATAGSSPTVA